SYPETRLDCTTSGRVCQGADVCMDPCDSVTRDSPPAPACVDDSTERVPTLSGMCEPSDGTCDYGVGDFACGATEACIEGDGCVDCQTLGCGNAHCAASEVCMFGYNFDFEDWSQSNPPFTYFKDPTSSFTVVQETTTVSRG